METSPSYRSLEDIEQDVRAAVPEFLSSVKPDDLWAFLETGSRDNREVAA